jgi:hypothetical protein
VGQLRHRRLGHGGQRDPVQVVAEGQLDGLGLQDSVAVELAVAEERRHEARVVTGCAVRTVPGRPELGVRDRHFETVDCESAVGGATVNRHQNAGVAGR